MWIIGRYVMIITIKISVSAGIKSSSRLDKAQ